MTQLQQRAKEMSALVETTDPSKWVEQGAPEAYVQQRKTLLSLSFHLQEKTRQLGEHPERLSLALQVMFLLQSTEGHLSSLSDGVRNYQDAKLGEQLSENWAANVTNRDKLRNYAVELAAIQEAEREIMNKEAQRCRADLNRRPADQQPQPVRTPKPAKKSVPAAN